MTTTVAIYTDGLGTYQAQCLSCDWRGPWRRKEAKAVEDGKSHIHDGPDLINCCGRDHLVGDRCDACGNPVQGWPVGTLAARK